MADLANVFAWGTVFFLILELVFKYFDLVNRNDQWFGPFALAIIATILGLLS